jgi:hypothetical protein
MNEMPYWYDVIIRINSKVRYETDTRTYIDNFIYSPAVRGRSFAHENRIINPGAEAGRWALGVRRRASAGEMS